MDGLANGELLLGGGAVARHDDEKIHIRIGGGRAVGIGAKEEYFRWLELPCDAVTERADLAK